MLGLTLSWELYFHTRTLLMEMMAKKRNTSLRSSLELFNPVVHEGPWEALLKLVNLL